MRLTGFFMSVVSVVQKNQTYELSGHPGELNYPRLSVFRPFRFRTRNRAYLPRQTSRCCTIPDGALSLRTDVRGDMAWYSINSDLTGIRVTEENSDITACKSTKIFCCRVFRRTRRVPSDFFGWKSDLPGVEGLQKTQKEVKMAEEERFELSDGFPSAVFKTAALSRSATPPQWRAL